MLPHTGNVGAGRECAVEPKRETATEVLVQTNSFLRRAKELLGEIDAKLTGPQPTSKDSCVGGAATPGGALTQAFEARSQAQVIVECLEVIAQAL